MHLTAAVPALPTTDSRRRAAPPGLADWFWRDRLMLSASVFCGLLIGFQWGLQLLHPAWAGAVTDWIGAVMAWPILFVVTYVSLQLTRTGRASAPAWWMWSAALLFYAIGHTVSRAYDPLNFSFIGAFPIIPSLFYLLQYPFFFLAVILLPRARRRGGHLLMIVDGLLLMGGVTALSWYFIIQPMAAQGGWPPVERAICLAFPIGDLAMLFGLTLILLQPSRYEADRLVLSILVVATMCLFAADFWAAWHLLHSSQPYTLSNPSDALWVPFYLLVPLAALAQLRLAQREPAANTVLAVKALDSQTFERQDVVASLRLFLPIVIALAASVAILIRATMTAMEDGWQSMIGPFVICVGLLFLIIMRQGTAYVETARLQRENEVTRAREMALRESDRRKDEFLTIVSHELKTPLTSLQGYIQLLGRRFAASGRPKAEDDLMHRAIGGSEESILRISRLVDDLLDESRLREGRLALKLEPCELSTIVRAAVEEQRLLHADRLIRLELQSAPALVIADALRIRQVVTNYLMNALKYSQEDQPVEVRLEVAAEVARVDVRDHGPGVPASEQAHVWERYYRVEGIHVQSGSRVGLGVGLYISKGLIEAHHGQVGVSSTPGQGSTFWFTLPLIDAQAA